MVFWPLDEVAIFNVALTEDDIVSIMNKGLKHASAVERTGKLTTIWKAVRIFVDATKERCYNQEQKAEGGCHALLKATTPVDA